MLPTEVEVTHFYGTHEDTKSFSKGWKSGLWVNFVNFLAPVSGPGYVSPFPIRIRIEESQSMWIHADPDSQHLAK